MPSVPRATVVPLGALLLALATFQEPTAGQGQLPPPPRPGWVLVDDMWLPSEAVLGDGFFTGIPWAGGNVPYAFDPNVSQAQRTAFRDAIADLEAVCGVDFYPRTSETSYILVRAYAAINGAQSPVGMIGGVQELAVATNLTNKFTYIHELMHALGYAHEHTRPDRDSFILVNWNNIGNLCGVTGNQACTGNFQVISGATYGPYDFQSIMHYSQSAWSNGGGNTITCLPAFAAFQTIMGTGQSMSYGDANGLIARYGATTVIPLISGISPGAVPQGATTAAISIYGSGFHEGSTDGSGVPGTIVKINGVDVSSLNVDYVSPTQLDVVVPPFHLINPGCLEVRVENVFGGASAPWYLGVSPAVATAGFWTGSGVGAHMGGAVAGLGDVDGDGYGDVVAGSFGESLAGQQYHGRVSCFSGRTGVTIWSILGSINHGGNGTSLANVGDIDGDGTDDVIEGAPATYGTASGTGFAYIRRGHQGGVIRSYLSGQLGDGFGTAVGDAGDINSDGVRDQIVGAPNGARIRIYSGASGGLMRNTPGPSGSRFGAAVAGGFDLNGDGIPDQAIGAPAFDNNRGQVTFLSGANGSVLTTRTGNAFGDRFGSSVAVIPPPDGRKGGAVVVGAPGGTNAPGYVRIYGPLTPIGLTGAGYPLLGTLTGLAAGDEFGTSVAAAGDIDQDGRMDIAVGAGQFNAGPGYIHVYSGRTLSRIARFTGQQHNDRFGSAVASVGDTDGDGLPDLVAGAGDASLGCLLSGYAAILHPVVPPEQRKVMLTEVYWGGAQAVEITSFATTPIDLTGWRVAWDDGTRRLSSPLPASTIIAPGEAIIVRELVINCIGCPPLPLQQFYPEAPPGTRWFALFPTFTPSANPTRISLVTDAGIIADDLRMGPVTDSTYLEQIGSGGTFCRGTIRRSTTAVSVERIWGLDSNSGADWTQETSRSFGLENCSSGPRGFDQILVPHVVINEIDDSPDYVELRNVSGGPLDLRNWFLLASARQGVLQNVIRPWPDLSFVLADGAYVVLGDGASAPAELPSGVSYVDLSSLPAFSGGNLPWIADEADCSLYDAYGRLVDLVRTTGAGDQRVHNHPRSPAPFGAFGGAAQRSSSGPGSFGRDNGSTDTDSGADWRPLNTRTMGFFNSSLTYAGPPGHGDKLDMRLNEGLLGDGLTIIINAGPVFAFHRYSFGFSLGHQNGLGSFLGLGPEAFSNWLILSQIPPWSGTLDARGSARIDLPTGTLPPGLMTDNLFLVQDPAGALVLRTLVLEWDT